MCYSVPHTLWSYIASACVLGCSLLYMPGISVQLFPFGAFDAEVVKSPSHDTPTSSRSPWIYSKPRMTTGGSPGTLFPLIWYHVDHTYICLPQSLLFTYLCYLGHNRVQPILNPRCNLRPNSSARTYMQVHRHSYYVNIDENLMLFTAVVLLHYMSTARRIRRLLLLCVPACPR